MNGKILGGLMASALMLAGCGGATETAKNTVTNTAKNTASQVANGNVPVTNVNAGGVSGTTGQLPADFPKDIPVYTGAAVIAGGTATTGAMAGSKGASFSTSDDGAKVADFYKAELTKQGWADVKSMSIPGGMGNTVMATKEKRSLSIAIMKGPDGKTMITVGETEKK